MFYDFITKYTDIFVKKNERSFCTFFNKKNWRISDINIRNFNETLTYDVGSFEQLDPGCGKIVYLFLCVTESPIMDDFDDHSEGSRKVITWAGFQT